MQTGLLRCNAHFRRPMAKTLVAFTSTRATATKQKSWTQIKKQSNSLLSFDSKSHTKVNNAVILTPHKDGIVTSADGLDKSLQEAAETLDESTIADKPRKFRSNTPFIYNVERPRSKAEAEAQSHFSSRTREFLRHSVLSKGFRILPDGFVRVSDILRDEYYMKYSFEQFARYCLKDPARDFDLIHMPDFIEGQLQDVWWVRAKRAHSIPGVDSSHHRILNMARLRALYCLCEPKDSENIRQHGVSVKNLGRKRLYRSLENVLFENMHFAAETERLCISIDSDVAAKKGVMFFMTQDRKTYTIGNPDMIILPEALLGATLLKLTSTTLLHQHR